MRKIFFCLLLFLFFGKMIFSHPHVFIVSNATFEFDDQQFLGVNVEWMFDEMFSEFIFTDYDINNNKNFEKSEVKKIEAEAFSNLEEYHYFSFIKHDNKDVELIQVSDFSVIAKGKKIIYSFFIKAPVQLIKPNGVIRFAFFDPTYYIDLQYSEEKSISFKRTDKVDVTYKMINNFDKEFDGKTIFPEEVHIQYQRK